MSQDERVFVCFRWADAHPEDDSIAGEARALSQRIDAEGGMVAAWLLPLLVASFEKDAWREAVELACDRAQVLPVAVGIASSRSELIDVAGRRVGLAVGPGIGRSVALARLGVKGEVLVDPDAEPVQRRSLLAAGTLRGIVDGRRARGRRVDVGLPWRDAHDLGLGSLAAESWTGPLAVSDLSLGVGALSAVFAARGSGGTRFLQELARERADARLLRLSPGPPGEPLGSLRAALHELVLDGRVPEALQGEYAASFEALLGGEGLDHEAALTLIGVALGIDAAGIGQGVVIDEADAVDADTLAVVADACRQLDVFVVARIVEHSGIPAPLAGLTRAHELTFPPATAGGAALLVRAFTGGALDDRLAARFARRGGFCPVGMQQALALAVEDGELVWQDDRFVVRGRRSGRGRPRGMAAIVERRLSARAPDERLLLQAFAVLGGSAPLADAEALLGRVGRAVAAGTHEPLVRDGWLVGRGAPTFGVPSSAVTGALRARLAPAQAVAWQRAAADHFEAADTPASLSRATVHRLLSGDAAAAGVLASRAAAALRAAGLPEAAAAFESLARSGDPAPLIERRLLPNVLLSESVGAGQSVRPAGSAEVEPRFDALIRHFELDQAEVDVGRVVASWRARDFAALERYVAELRGQPASAALADRVTALTLLARRRVGEALQLLRQSKASVGADAAARSRAGLALGVGLAAAGRMTDALLETLDSLACARAASDVRGERACARFLAELSRGVGADSAAARWSLLGAS